MKQKLLFSFDTCWTGIASVLVDGDDFTFSPGPILNGKMDKDEVVAFIQMKSEKILEHLDAPEQREAYFFWEIMDLYCNSTRKVLMADIATRLLKAHRCLRIKAPHLVHAASKIDWCMPLARLLYSASPDDELLQAVLKMADSLVCRGQLFAAHIYCVVAQVELGSYKDSSFDLIGCSRLPRKKAAIREAMERSEVYEYVMHMTSGSTMTKFLKYKAHYAKLLLEEGHPSLALDYCESVARTFCMSPSPSSIKAFMIQKFIQISEKVLQWTEKEPEWMFKLRNPHYTWLTALLGSRYDLGDLLGEGAFGSVYAGVRRADGKKVAIKFAVKTTHETYITIPGQTNSLPMEVGLMQMVSVPPVCENIVELIEWIDLPTCFILILERPSPCTDLTTFCSLNKGRLPESLTRDIMQQVVQAVCHCFERGVFHSDIKSDNLLINTETMQVKLIDFGCGKLLTDSSYRQISGTPTYWPPEWILTGKHMGRPATVWSLGVLMHLLVSGVHPFNCMDAIAYKDILLCCGLSADFNQLIQWCLEKNPDNRATVEDITNHKWFSTINKWGDAPLGY